MRSREEIEAEAEANRRRLLAAEAAALLLLQRRRDGAIEEGLRRGRSLPRIAQAIQGELRGAIVAARVLSRTTGVDRLGSELAGLGVPDRVFAAVSPSEAARDVARAKAAAASFAERWLKKTVRPGAPPPLPATVASAETAGSLRRIAATENAEAFNRGRERAAKKLPPLGLLRVWDAQLDKRTCSTCSRMDGTVVGLRERFSVGEPGTLHPYDRCTFTVLTTDEDERGALIQPAPVQLVARAS